MLRYFERKSAREMAEILDTSEDAAQKRVNRAVDHLREMFSKRRLTVGAGGLAALISANAVQSAPVELRITISAAMAKTAAGIGAGAKGLVATKIGTILGSAGAFIPMLGSLYFSSKVIGERAKSPRVRQPLTPYFWIETILIVILTLLGFNFFPTSSSVQTKEDLFFGAIILGLLFLFDRCSKKRQRIQMEDGAWVESESLTDKQRNELLANVRKHGSKKLMYSYLSQACLWLSMTMLHFKPGFNGNWKHAALLFILIGLTIFSSIEAWRSRPRRRG
jgi:hypothetical protein